MCSFSSKQPINHHLLPPLLSMVIMQPLYLHLPPLVLGSLTLDPLIIRLVINLFYLTCLILILCIMSLWQMTLKSKYKASVRHTHLQTCLFVLYVSGSPLNLVYVKNITRTIDCSTMFINNSVYVLDRCTRQTIRTGSECEGYIIYHPRWHVLLLLLKSLHANIWVTLALIKCIFQFLVFVSICHLSVSHVNQANILMTLIVKELIKVLYHLLL